MLWRLLASLVSALVLLGATFSAVPTFAAELIVDNSDNSVQVKGKWTTTTTTDGFIGSDYLFRTPGDGNSTVTCPFPTGPAGHYEVFAHWSAGTNQLTNATYHITTHADTSSLLPT